MRFPLFGQGHGNRRCKWGIVAYSHASATGQCQMTWSWHFSLWGTWISFVNLMAIQQLSRHFTPSQRCQPTGGTREKSLRFIIWEPWMSVPTFMPIHLKFQHSRQSELTNWPTYIVISRVTPQTRLKRERGEKEKVIGVEKRTRRLRKRHSAFTSREREK